MPITRHSRFVHKRKYRRGLSSFILFVRSFVRSRRRRPCFLCLRISRDTRDVYVCIFLTCWANVTRGRYRLSSAYLSNANIVDARSYERAQVGQPRRKSEIHRTYARVLHGARNAPRRQWETIIDVRASCQLIPPRVIGRSIVIVEAFFERGIRPIFTSNRNHALASSIFSLPLRDSNVLRCANICFTLHTLELYPRCIAVISHRCIKYYVPSFFPVLSYSRIISTKIFRFVTRFNVKSGSSGRRSSQIHTLQTRYRCIDRKHGFSSYGYF